MGLNGLNTDLKLIPRSVDERRAGEAQSQLEVMSNDLFLFFVLFGLHRQFKRKILNPNPAKVFFHLHLNFRENIDLNL